MDPLTAAEVEDMRRTARRALLQFMASIAVTVAATAAAILLASDAVQNTVLGVGIAVVTLTGTNWWNARGAREADTQRVLALASIFLQRPGELRQLIRTERLDRVVENLLTTVLPTDDLGDELWSQGASPLIHRLRTNRFRRDQVYDVRLREQPHTLDVTLPDGDSLEIDPADWRELSADLSYTRAFDEETETVWVGLVFDPRGGPDWFADPGFVYREYMPLDDSTIDAICGSMPAAPRVLEGDRGRRLGGRPGATAALRERPERIRFADELCRARVSIDGVQLAADEVAADNRGLGIRFAVPPALRRRFDAEPWARVNAGLSFPLPQRVSVFPVYFPDLTLGGRIIFNHGDADVTEVTMDRFFSVSNPFSKEDVIDEPDRLEIGSGKWIFPDAGMVFSWRNRSATSGVHATPSMVPAATDPDERDSTQ